MNIGFADPRIHRILYTQDFDGLGTYSSCGQITVMRWGAAIQAAFMVAPAWRRKGVGTAMMRAFHQLVKGPKVAQVRPDNIPSMKILLACGFTVCSHEELLQEFGFPAHQDLTALRM